MNKEVLVKLYKKAHNKVCEILGIKLEPCEVEIVKEFENPWYSSKINIPERFLNSLEKYKEFGVTRLISILAHEDIHCIFDKLKIRESKIIEETLATMVEYITAFEFMKEERYKGEIFQDISKRLKFLLNKIKSGEKLEKYEIGYLLGLIVVSQLEREILKKLARAIFSSLR